MNDKRNLFLAIVAIGVIVTILGIARIIGDGGSAGWGILVCGLAATAVGVFRLKGKPGLRG